MVLGLSSRPIKAVAVISQSRAETATSQIASAALVLHAIDDDALGFP